MAGKSNQTVIPELSQEQKDYLKAQTNLLTGTLAPQYEQAVKGATNLYDVNAGGVLNAAQNLGTIAQQAQAALGGTGESALRSGITGLESLFDPNYEASQIQAAMAPGQAQYLQNVAGLQAGFGGAGNLGSARQALAGRQLAGTTAAQQASTAAQIEKDIAAQRLTAAQNLAQLGQGGIGQALAAAGTGVTAAMTPQDFYNKYASIIYGVPATSYGANFGGTQGSNTTTTGISLGTGTLGVKI